MEHTKKLAVLYHRNCADGFAAAWVALQAEAVSRGVDTVNELMAPGSSVIALPVEYDIHQDDLIEICRDARVYVVDYCFTPSRTTEIAKVAHSVVVLDHHKTAIEKMTGYHHPKVKLYFDQSYSGAGLAWKHFFGEQKIPTLLSYLQDYDLWTKQYPQSMPLVRGMQHMRIHDRQDWHAFDVLTRNEDAIMEVLMVGQTALEVEQSIIDDAIRESMVTGIKINGVDGGVLLNLPYRMSNMVGDTLNGKTDDIKFTCVYDYVNPEPSYPAGYIRLSFRSQRGSDIDLTKMLKKFGGGGHESSSGLKICRMQYYTIEDFLRLNKEDKIGNRRHIANLKEFYNYVTDQVYRFQESVFTLLSDDVPYQKTAADIAKLYQETAGVLESMMMFHTDKNWNKYEPQVTKLIGALSVIHAVHSQLYAGADTAKKLVQETSDYFKSDEFDELLSKFWKDVRTWDNQ